MSETWIRHELKNEDSVGEGMQSLLASVKYPIISNSPRNISICAHESEIDETKILLSDPPKKIKKCKFCGEVLYESVY